LPYHSNYSNTVYRIQIIIILNTKVINSDSLGNVRKAILRLSIKLVIYISYLINIKVIYIS